MMSGLRTRFGRGEVVSYTNNCDVPVNLSTVVTIVSNIVTNTLAVGATQVDTSLIGIKYIVCRPPSVGIDIDTRLLLVQFEYS